MDALSAAFRRDPSYQDASFPSGAASFIDMLREAGGVQLVNTPPKPPAPIQTTPGGAELDGKIQRQMGGRGWTPAQIDEAIKNGPRIDAINKRTGGAATRYVNPQTGQSVVVDNGTHRVIQVGKPGGKSGPDSGDVPGATMRPAPNAAPEAPRLTPETPTPPVAGSSPPIMPETPVAPEVPVTPEITPELPTIPDFLGPL